MQMLWLRTVSAAKLVIVPKATFESPLIRTWSAAFALVAQSATAKAAAIRP
jgi:hypothetical protein